jgi:hypothetical protein
VLYSRRLKSCGFCGAAIPDELRFSPDEIAALDREMAAWEEGRRQREKAREEEAEKAAEAAAQAAAQAGIPWLFFM